MNSFKIPYQRLQLIDYEAAGNKTPVVDLGVTPGIGNLNPLSVRNYLEKDHQFRVWLQREGKTHFSDSIMLYYQFVSSEFDFITFVGEPNSSLESGFSEMCGNGIRSLGLHITLSANDYLREQYLQKGIRIWAGEVRKVKIESIDEVNNKGNIRVNMGIFQDNLRVLKPYLGGKLVNNNDNLRLFLPEFILPRKLQGNGFGLGLNGALKGEPHLILVNSPQGYLQLIDYLGINLPIWEQSAILNSLRKAVNLLGNKVTFEKSLFPRGINFSVAVVLNQRIYISTHERNLASSRQDCRNQQNRYNRCCCNTASCGTAGAVAANLAYIRGLLRSKDIVTVHPGGNISYLLNDQGTIMTGEAKLMVAKGNVKLNYYI